MSSRPASIFNDATLATPGFGVNQRALLTGIDIYGLCAADGATGAQCNQNADFTNPNGGTPVLEPSALLLLSTAGVFLAGNLRRNGRASA